MVKKYGYQIEFLSRDLSPTGTKYYGATGECLVKEMKQNFQSFLKKHGYSTKGGATKGTLLNAKGQEIGKFEFSSNTIQ